MGQGHPVFASQHGGQRGRHPLAGLVVERAPVQLPVRGRDGLGKERRPVEIGTSHRHRGDDVRRRGGGHLTGRGAADPVGHELEVGPGEAGVLVVVADQSDVGRGAVGEAQHASLLPRTRSVVAGTARGPDRLSTARPPGEQSDAMEARSAALDRAREHAMTWLATMDERSVPPAVDADEMARRLGDLPDGPTPAADVVDLLAEACEPGLVAIPSGRFFGMVIGGSLPAALGADWLTSAWDQNVGLRALTPAAAAAEEVAGRWLVDLLGLPEGSAVGFVTGGTMANFTCLATARDTVLRRAGHDISAGLAAVPTGARPGRRRAPPLGRPAPAVPRPRRPGGRTRRREGPDPRRGPRRRTGGRRGSDGRGAAGRQHPLRRLRPVRRVRGRRPRARRMGPRGRRLRALGGRVAAVARGGRGARRGGLLGDGCAQDAQRALRLRSGDRSRRRRAGDARWRCTAST